MKKKILLLLFILTFVIISLSINVNATTIYQINTWKNEDFETVSYNSTTIRLTNDEYIRVDTNEEYFVFMSYIGLDDIGINGKTWKDLPFFSNLSIGMFDNDNESSFNEGMESYSDLICDGFVCGKAFTSVSDYVRFNPTTITTSTLSESEVNTFFTGLNVENYFLLIKAEDLNAYDFDYQYIAGDDDSYDLTTLNFGSDLTKIYYKNRISDILSPIIDSNTYTYITTVDNPIALSNLKSTISLTAYDEIDQDLTDNIVINESSNYTSLVTDKVNVSERTLGTYPITFYVEDSSGNNASCVVNIIVKDNISPHVVSGTTLYNHKIDDTPITIEEIKNNITVDDNYSNVTAQILNNTFESNEQKKGSYNVTLRYSDSSSNYIDVVITIINKDETSPVISSSSTTTNISYSSPINISTLLDSLDITVNDNYDDCLSYSIETDNYSINNNKVGQYDIVLMAVDSSDNIGRLTIVVEVKDNISPIFYLDESKVVVEVGVLFNSNDVLGILKNSKVLRNKSFTTEVIEDNYSNNYNNPGTYDYKIKIIYEDGESYIQSFKVNVLEKETKPKHKITFMKKMWLGIKKIASAIWRFVSYPFRKLFDFIF